MIRLRPSGVDEVLIKRVRDWYEPGPGVFITSMTGASFSPAMLFTTGVNGVWYDPSDFTTLFQDAAGTTPVTAVEQPVGRILDKSGRGNHAFNPSGNSANFPVLSARYNLLTKTEQFDDAAWSKVGAQAITANAIAAPDGTQSADKLRPSAVSDLQAVYQVSTFTATSYTISISAKAAEYSWLFIRVDGVANGYVWFNLGNGTVGTTAANRTPTISSQGNGWYRCTVSWVSIGGSGNVLIGASNADNVNTFAGDGTSGIYIWGADLRVANDALNQPAYQRVNTSTDYDTAGFKPYLRFNGTNQWLQTNSIDFTYGDKMFVSAGVRKLSDAAFRIIAEISPVVDLNNGAMAIGASIGGAQRWVSALRGTSLAYYEPATYAAPDTNVLATSFDIAGAGISSEIVPRVNGVIEQDNPFGASAGTGNFGNYPLYIGARAGTTAWFNGRLYQMVVAGKQASAAEITSTETYLNQKTGAY